MDQPTKQIESPAVTRRALFLCFLSMGLISFGGVLPWARRMLVEQRGWLTDEEFVDALSLGQALPGPNIVNVSIMVGARFHGASGAILAFSGLMLAPLALILLLASLYAHYGQLEAVTRTLNGMAAGTAGLVVAMGFKMLARHPKAWTAWMIVALAFIAAGLLRLPLLMVLGVLGPVSIFLAWRRLR